MPVSATPPQPSQFDAVRGTLAGLDPAGLAAAAGGLSLLPANGHRLWRLGALAALAAERNGGGEGVNHSRLRSRLDSGPLAAIAGHQEDPFDDLLTEELTFYGGSYLVGPGLAEHSVYVLRLLLRGLLLSAALPDALRAELTSLSMAALRLSDHVLRGAGLERHQGPTAARGDLVEVPGQSRLRRLMELCTFTDEELARISGGYGLLDPLVLVAGERRFDDTEVTWGFADRWPLLRFGERLVLARPFDLLLAVRHRMLVRAVEDIGAGEVAKAFASAVRTDVLQSLRRMNITTSVVGAQRQDQSWIEVQAEMDVGLLLVAAIVPDSLEELGEDPYGSFDAAVPIEEAKAIFERRAAEYDGQVLGLLVVQPAGRAVFIGLNDPVAPNLTLEVISGADLESFSLVEHDERLALWKFAAAHSALRSRAMITGFSTLDTYAIYRGLERSLAPMHEATGVWMTPGAGAKLRSDAKCTRDRHGAKYVDGTVREVEREGHHGLGKRLYHVSEPDEPRLLRHVAGAPLDLWVRGPAGVEILRRSWDVVETVAYWLGELVDPLNARFAALAEKTPCLQIDVDFADREFWFEHGVEPDPDPGDRLEVEGRSVRLVLGNALRQAASRPDNAGERVLVARIVEALDELAESLGLPRLAEQDRSDAIEQAAPLGLKKHLLVLPAANNPLMAPVDGRARVVQEGDVSAARELVGAHLMQRFGLEVGPVPQEQRQEIVREAVAFFLAEVQALLDGTRPDGLLESLLMENERLIVDSESRLALLPARAATYPTAVEQERLREQVATAARAAVCCRFLAEYVAARPPTGADRWSVTLYDRAMALAGVMLDWAYLSDALYYGMTDVGLLINSDHQLRLQERDRYDRGRSSYFDVQVAGQRRSAEQIFPLRFDDSERAEPGQVLARVNPFFVQEAGVSFSELGDLLSAISELALAAGKDVLAMEHTATIEALTDTLNWDRSKVERAVAYLSMAPREQFGPAGRGWQDVVPSRFARRFSLNRRPLLLRGDQLLWGQRQPLVTLRIILGQIFSGRFQSLAETDALQAELSRVANEAGRAFEHQVANLLDASPRFTVRERVTSLGGESIERENGETLGDVDVLAADTLARTLYGVECKDLFGALTPAEVASELSEHFNAATGVTTAKHKERIDWLQAHRAQALRDLGIDGTPERWQVKGIFVTSSRVMAPHITDVGFPIVAADDLPDWISRLPNAHRHDRKRKARRN